MILPRDFQYKRLHDGLDIKSRPRLRAYSIPFLIYIRYVLQCSSLCFYNPYISLVYMEGLSNKFLLYLYKEYVLCMSLTVCAVGCAQLRLCEINQYIILNGIFVFLIISLW